MRHQQQIDHMMVDDKLCLFQTEVLEGDNDDHVPHGIQHIDHIAKIQSEKKLTYVLKSIHSEVPRIKKACELAKVKSICSVNK